MNSGKERMLEIVEILFGKEIVASALNREVMHSVCEGCCYGRQLKNGTYECYKNYCPFGEEKE